MAKSWYNMTPAKAEGGAAEILLYDVIGGWGVSAKQFAEDLKALGGGSITLRINSPGGDVMEGAAIYNILKADGRPVTAYIDGLAASMASVVAMAAGRVVMPANALMMIHNPWTVSAGDAERLRKDADLLDKIKGQIVGAYEAKCGAKKTHDEIVAMMDAETWMDGKEAVEAGLADECGEELKAAACAVDVGKFAAKVDARLAALMPKESDHVAPPAQSGAPAAVVAPVLLDAAVVATRIDSERAEAYAQGAASRDAEVAMIRAELDGARAEIKTLKGNVEQLTAAVKAERDARVMAEQARDKAKAAHETLLGGLKFTPSDVAEQGFEALQAKYGYKQAREKYPDAYAAFMREKAPATRQHK
jgi:ATP-dependent protease ClpP protease subunit